MPRLLETTPTPCFDPSTKISTALLSAENGARTVAAFAGSLRLPSATWIVTTITLEGCQEDWRVQVIKDATR